MSSRFKALFDEATKIEPISEEKPEKNTPRKRLVKGKQEKPIIVPPQQNRNKIKGKRSNPEYTGAFAYIPGKLHEEIKIKLLRNKNLDFSGLVEDLLTKWLNEQN